MAIVALWVQLPLRVPIVQGNICKVLPFLLFMNFESYLKSYKIFLQTEKGLSQNTVLGYVGDVKFFLEFLSANDNVRQLTDVNYDLVSDYLRHLNENNISGKSQSRIISSLRSFFKYLVLEKIITDNPMKIIEFPKLGLHLPDVLSVEDVEKIIASIDLSVPLGQRNRAILETLYGTGVRVSELVSLRLSDLFFDDGFIRVIGKGNKERLVPIGSMAVKQIKAYVSYYRNHVTPKKNSEDILFLNNRGGKLTREMVFIMVKQIVENAGVKKKVSPHTFRHSFATHLIQNGADIRVVQEMLGHESIVTTEIYTHIDSAKLKETIDKYHPFAHENF